MMATHRSCGCTRRMFLARTGAATLGLGLSTAFPLCGGMAAGALSLSIRGAGPASTYIPRMKAACVRRKGEYGMRWPGAVYDGEAARKRYFEEAASAAKTLGIAMDIRPEPLYSLEEGEQWIAQSENEKLDGLLLLLLDRQEHAWPTAARVLDSAIPAVIFSPVGTSFTTNTAPLAAKPGAYICSTDSFQQAAYGLKMIWAGTKLRETRFVVIKGTERREEKLAPFGTKLRYVPADLFLEIYRETPVTAEIEAIASEYLEAAERVSGPTREDVINGVKSFVVARTLLEREEADAITMDCLGALGKTAVSLPCIAWSRMLDYGIPAACEADIEACICHALVQYLFNRPGFQQDPVADTGNDCLIGAHCTCATRLNGIDAPPEPFFLSYHHGNRDAVPVPHWKSGQRVTVLDILLNRGPGAPPQMLISAGEVVDNVAVPPAGGCVVSVRIKLDGERDLLAMPGFHQLFFYGDFKKELLAYSRLYGLDAQVV